MIKWMIKFCLKTNQTKTIQQLPMNQPILKRNAVHPYAWVKPISAWALFWTNLPMLLSQIQLELVEILDILLLFSKDQL